MEALERRYSWETVCEWFTNPDMPFGELNIPVDPSKHFSVLVVGIGDPANEKAMLQRLMERLNSRVPGCRRIGWDDDRHIAVLCPDTGAEDAARLNEIAAMTVAFAGPGHDNMVVMYTYHP